MVTYPGWVVLRVLFFLSKVKKDAKTKKIARSGLHNWLTRIFEMYGSTPADFGQSAERCGPLARGGIGQPQSELVSKAVKGLLGQIFKS